MRSSDRRRSLILLLAAAALLGAGAGSPVRAQDAPPDAPAPATGESLFGAYDLVARGQGVQAYYEIEGLLPGGSPILDFGMPEALARFSSGPSGYGLASLAYPGGLLVNLGSLIEQTGAGQASDVPPYPVKEEAFYPTGPTEAGSAPPGGPSQQVTTGPLGVDVLAAFPGLESSPAISVGSITTSARTSIEDGKAVSRSRVVVSGINILGGVLSIESVTTDLAAVHDGEVGSTAGGTSVAGVRFLGLAASLTEDGLVLDHAPDVTGPGAALGSILTPLVPGLQDALTPLQQALGDLLDQVTLQLDDLLSAAGIDIDFVSPEEQVAATGGATRNSSGLSINLRYEGREQDALVDLIQAIPEDLRPSLGPIPNPISFLTENHIASIAIAPASVAALATPPFPDFVGPVDPLPPTTGPGTFDPGGGFDAPAFETPLPDLPTPTPSADGGAADLATDTTSSVASGAIPAALVLLTMLAAPLLGLGSSRLADHVLAPVGATCPIGLDQPPPPTRPS